MSIDHRTVRLFRIIGAMFGDILQEEWQGRVQWQRDRHDGDRQPRHGETTSESDERGFRIVSRMMPDVADPMWVGITAYLREQP